eukprot:CAMPEP_0204504094 /NCGR_PEP_ID=MMETSP0471-20130131/104804_1 /ASSEMBLY_ACC=CAM_ASM_000602 /TAXON_ID=2969 /ORGANISM="Oxyrrhis marina" /LENGTH=31 /DNA_ID= /DNA_START= /DNA_END= /DNA_ORIENTATION=
MTTSSMGTSARRAQRRRYMKRSGAMGLMYQG